MKRPSQMTDAELAALPTLDPKHKLLGMTVNGDDFVWIDSDGVEWSFEQMPDGTWARQWSDKD